MDVKAYIESGILELYTMEALSTAESREVEALASMYPEIKQEIERVQQALNGYALLHADEPRQGLKQVILEKVQPKPKTKSAPGAFCRSWVVIAGGMVALAAIILAGIYFNRAKRLEKDLELVVAQRETLQNNYNRLVANFELINRPSTKIIVLKSPDPKYPEYEATIYWDQEETTTLLAIKNLPRPPAGKKYQLWTIKGAAPPVPAGLIDFNSLDFQQMVKVATADAFAITLEDEDGSDQPTLPIYVVGSAG